MNSYRFLSLAFLAIFSTGVLFYHSRQSLFDDIHLENTALKSIFPDHENVFLKSGSPPHYSVDPAFPQHPRLQPGDGKAAGLMDPAACPLKRAAGFRPARAGRKEPRALARGGSISSHPQDHYAFGEIAHHCRFFLSLDGLRTGVSAKPVLCSNSSRSI